MTDCCLHEDRWAEHDKRIAAVEGDNANTRRRLFFDNGSPSIQTRLDRLERVVAFAAWVAGVAATGTIGQIGYAVFQATVRHVSGGAP